MMPDYHTDLNMKGMRIALTPESVEALEVEGLALKNPYAAGSPARVLFSQYKKNMVACAALNRDILAYDEKLKDAIARRDELRAEADECLSAAQKIGGV